MTALPSQFLRSLETDLRALCADARRRNRAVKDAAEHAILSIKEANSPASERAAADESAATFCAACNLPEPPNATDPVAAQIPVSLKAVSCLHKLLTHQAISNDRLVTVLDALEEVASYSHDDSLTLKVLQAILSLLTVRTYVAVLDKASLSRAISLLLRLRSGQSVTSGAFSAITSRNTQREDGIIEQTVQVAFRQVACDLFATATERMCKKVDEMPPSVHRASKNEGTETSPTTPNGIPSEAEGAIRLFKDLCAAAAGDPVQFLSYHKENALENATVYGGINPTLALEVLDDGLLGNIQLFSQVPQFKNILVSRLCPAIHELFRSDLALQEFRSLSFLVVTVIRNYWEMLIPDCEILLSTLIKLARVSLDTLTNDMNAHYKQVFALECLFGIVRQIETQDSSAGEQRSLVVEFIQAYDEKKNSTNVVLDMFSYTCNVADQAFDVPLYLNETILSSSRPFSQLSVDLHKKCSVQEVFVSLGVAVLISVQRAIVLLDDDSESTLKLMLLIVDAERAKQVANVMFKMISASSSARASLYGNIAIAKSEEVLSILLDSIVDVIELVDRCGHNNARSQAIVRLASESTDSLKKCSKTLMDTDTTAGGEQLRRSESQALGYYRHLLSVIQRAGRSLDDISWQPVVGAMHAASKYLSIREARGSETPPAQSNGTPHNADIRLVSLQETIAAMVEEAMRLPWNSYTSLLKVLIQHSRSELSQKPDAATRHSRLPVRGKEDSTSTGDDTSSSNFDFSIALKSVMTEYDLFGLRWAEKIFTNALSARNFMMPYTTYQLFIGYLVTLGRTHTSHSVRKYIASVTKSVVICSLSRSGGSQEEGNGNGADNTNGAHPAEIHQWCLQALCDLFASDNTYEDTKLYTLNTLFSVLQSRGAVLNKSEQWRVILSILISAMNPYVSSSKTSKLEEAIVHGESSGETNDDDRLPDEAGTGVVESSSRRPSVSKTSVSRPTSSSIKSVNAVFRCVQLIGSDFLGSLNGDALSLWIKLLCLCASQGEAVNIALTSIVLLWRTADQIARLVPSHYPLLARAVAHISVNPQPSIRNSAIKTMAAALSSHANVLPLEIWNKCVDESLIPLLQIIMGTNIQMQPGLSNGEFGSRDSEDRSEIEKQSSLLVHHTRDTTRKQWNESRVLVLSGVSRVLRVGKNHGRGTLSAKRIQVLVGEATKAASEREKEVAVAGVLALVDFLRNSSESFAEANETAVAEQSLSETRDAVWTSLIRLTNGNEIIQDAAFILVGELSSVQNDLRKLEILFALASAYRETYSADDSRLIKLVLEEIQNVDFGTEQECWEHLVDCLIRFVFGRDSRDGRARDRLDRPGTILLRHLFQRDQVPDVVLVNVVDEVLKQSASVMKTQKDKTPDNNLYPDDEILESFLIVMQKILRVKDAQFTFSFWQGLEQCICEVLKLERRASRTSDAAEWGVRVVNILRKLLITSGGGSEQIEQDVQKRLLVILSSGARERVKDANTYVRGLSSESASWNTHQEQRPQFVHACQKALFALTDISQLSSKSLTKCSSRISLVRAASEELVGVIQIVLRRFIPDCIRSGRCPLPIMRRIEVTFLLKGLTRMVSFVSSYTESEKKEVQMDESIAKLSTEDLNVMVKIQRKVLQAVYPSLCECIDCTDELVRHEARSLLEKTVDVLGDAVLSRRPRFSWHAGNHHSRGD